MKARHYCNKNSAGARGPRRAGNASYVQTIRCNIDEKPRFSVGAWRRDIQTTPPNRRSLRADAEKAARAIHQTLARPWLDWLCYNTVRPFEGNAAATEYGPTDHCASATRRHHLAFRTHIQLHLEFDRRVGTRVEKVSDCVFTAHERPLRELFINNNILDFLI
jgi:hypothetical protein